jgi:hypothetical protein
MPMGVPFESVVAQSRIIQGHLHKIAKGYGAVVLNLVHYNL